MHFQAYVYIIFVYRVVYVDMSTRSSQLNHLNLWIIESFRYLPPNRSARIGYVLTLILIFPPAADMAA